MQIQEILEGKKIVEFLIEKGFQIEKGYCDPDFKEGVYFKIDKRKLLVFYEVFEEEKIKEVKDHFLIDIGLSYCIIKYNSKLIFYRSFGENKYFIYSERTKDKISKIDKLKKISEEGFDFIFQAGYDISGQFYELFRDKRNLLASNIANDILPTEKYLIAQKIFDRFFFIYFLCHKGIIKFNNGNIISGKNLFEILISSEDFIDNTKKLFSTFNSQETNILKINNYEIMIPYLNGGLFRPDVLEKDLDITLKIEQWKEIFSFLNSYHWIIEDVKASEEYEDKILTPEILGHVYERSVVEWEKEGFEKEAEKAVNKLSERKKKGVYYTPESITDYISKNTIIPYLLEKLGNTYKSFEELIESNNNNSYNNAITILDNIKIIDPACGSGAFLIKASDIIFGLKRRLLFLLGQKKNYYDMKLEIITKNIYGVDILAGAIEISKLRLWLWLISDYEDDNNQINALPNIEYNLKIGNSLIGWIDEKLSQMTINTPSNEVDYVFTDLLHCSKLENTENLKKARELLNSYSLNGYIEAYDILYNIYRLAHGLEADNLRIILENVRGSIYNSITPAFLSYINNKIKPGYNKNNPPITKEFFSKLQVFHWRVDFGTIIMNGGFDLIIGNPPYIQIKQISSEYKKIYETRYEFTNGRFNIFYLFIELAGKKLVKSQGISSFIVPDRLLLNTQCSNLREWLLRKQTILEIDSFKKGVFESAVVDNIIIFFKNEIKKYDNVKIKNKIEPKELSNVKVELVPTLYFNNSPNMQFDLDFMPEKSELIKKICNNSVKLGDISDIRDGIIQSKIPDILFLKEYIDIHSKKLLFGKDVNKYKIHFNNNWVNYNPEEMMKIELQRNGGGLRLRNKEIFERKKILTRQTSDKIIAAFDDNSYYYSNTLHGTTITNTEFSPLFVLAILNSSLINWYYKVTTAEGGKVFAQVKIEILKLIPIKKTNIMQQSLLIELVEKIHNITKDEDYLENSDKQNEFKNLEKQIDNLVYELYELTNNEIKIIEEFFMNKDQIKNKISIPSSISNSLPEK